ncbi:MAG: tripartite tricarboxylate transporter permease [bacterium]
MLEALSSVLTLQTTALMLAGLVGGIVAGALPGLTATMSVALLVPFTFALDPMPGLMMLVGVYIGTMHGGAISAILIHTPGTPAAAATCFDGYPLAQQGKASLALNVSAIASTCGGVASAIVLALVAAQIAGFALRIGYFEMFALALFGLSIIAGVSEGSLTKGLIMGAAGMFISTVGFDPIDAYPRFTFGEPDLYEGISYIPLLIGVFAMSEALIQAGAPRGNAGVAEGIRNVFPGPADLKRLVPAISLSSAIGTLVGAIPGAGGDIASFMAYDQARKISKKPEEFGSGSIEGVAAAETANNAVTGGAMIPMLTLGIPGDSVTAILLGALIVHGLRPGPRLFEENAGFVNALFAGLLITNLLVLPIRLIGAPLFARAVNIPRHFLWPLVVVLCVVGSFSMTNTMFSVTLMLAAGVAGYLLRLQGFPMGPLVLGVILGPIAEENLRNALRAHPGDVAGMIASPIAAVFIALAVLSLVLPLVQDWQKKRKRIS